MSGEGGKTDSRIQKVGVCMQVTKVTNNGRQIVIGKNHHVNVIVVGWTLTKKYVVNFAKKKVQLVETSPIQNLLLLFYILAR